MEKTCSKCKTTKELTEFNKRKDRKEVYRSQCRECERESQKLYRENNREKVSESKKFYYENNREKELDRNKLYRENNREKRLLQKARERAKKKSLPFSIVKEDITIPNTCPVLDIPLFSGEGTMCDNSPNLDRIIPEKGYVPGNVRVISNKANRIKSNATVEELRAVLKDYQKQLMILESEKINET